MINELQLELGNHTRTIDTRELSKYLDANSDKSPSLHGPSCPQITQFSATNRKLSFDHVMHLGKLFVCR